MLNTVFAK